MPSSIRTLLEASGLLHAGVVPWAHTVPVEGPGVYLVSLTHDTDTAAGALPSALINLATVEELLQERPELTVDNIRGTAATLSARVGEFWLPDENILYIGLAGTSLETRVKQFYSTKLGRRSPHAGGWFLKLLANLGDLYVHYATADDVEQAEDRMLAAFVVGVSPGTKERLRDPDHPFPYANLEWPKGVRKSHGIRGATGTPGTSTPVAGTPPVGDSQRIYPRPPRPGTGVRAINQFLQRELRRRERTEVAAVEAARWLDQAGLLADSKIRPGLPLRDLLRAESITGQRQEANRRWFIGRVDGR